MEKILLIEPYYAGSHRQLIDLLYSELGAEKADLVTMTGKKWHWRARTSALHLSQSIPTDVNYKTIFTSSVLPLNELLALRPQFQNSRKLIYFHENQLVYPVRKSKDRDFQYGYNQILSCMVADVVIFNSHFNMDSFLANLKKFLKTQPDYRPKNLREAIEPKCRVLYFPICFDSIGPRASSPKGSRQKYRILWPHRWEFDKNPDLFFKTLYRLVEDGFTNFRLSILGENFADNCPVFTEAKDRLSEYIDHFGYLPGKEEYYDVLRSSDIVISTAHHEFFGVAMMEAVYCGCFPLCPDALVYPEIFKSKSLFRTDEELFRKLKLILQEGNSSVYLDVPMDFSTYDWKQLKSQYLTLFENKM